MSVFKRSTGRVKRAMLEVLAEQPALAPLKVTELAGRMERMARVVTRKGGTVSSGFEHEFMYTLHLSELSAFKRESGNADDAAADANIYKNRYANILPYDATRVRLATRAPTAKPVRAGPLVPAVPDPEPGLSAEGPYEPSVLPDMVDFSAIGIASDYINASFLSGQAPGTERAYIAAQAPLPWTAEAFWTMIWDEGVRTVVMLTDVVESDVVKADVYWPPPRSAAAAAAAGGTDTAVGPASFKLGPFWIACNGYEYDDSLGVDERDLVLSREAPDGSTESRNLKQFHFRLWPDHGVPEDSHKLLALIRRIWSRRELAERDLGISPPPPLLVHCSAGVGRSGVFIVVDAIVTRIRADLDAGLTLDEITVSIPLAVLTLRQQRQFIVQTPAQYELCYLAVLEYLHSVGLPNDEDDDADDASAS